MESWFIVYLGIQFFSDKFNLTKVFHHLLIRGIMEISIRRHIFPTEPLNILHPYKQTTEYMRKKTSQQAGQDLFS